MQSVWVTFPGAMLQRELCCSLLYFSGFIFMFFSSWLVNLPWFYDLPWTSVPLSGSRFCLASILSLHLTSLTAHLARCDSSHPVLVVPQLFLFSVS